MMSPWVHDVSLVHDVSCLIFWHYIHSKRSVRHLWWVGGAVVRPRKGYQESSPGEMRSNIRRTASPRPSTRIIRWIKRITELIQWIKRITSACVLTILGCSPQNQKKICRGWTSIRPVFWHPQIATHATHPAQCLTQNTKGGGRQNRKAWCREGLFFFAGLIDVRFGMLFFFRFCRFFGSSDLDIGPGLLSRGEKVRGARNGKRV